MPSSKGKSPNRPRLPRSRKIDTVHNLHRGVTRPDPAASATQPQRLLLGVARQAGVGDPDSCQTILSILSASRAIRRAVDRELGTDELSEPRLATLITLYAMEPLACTAVDLAYHAEISRPAMTHVISALEQRGWITRDAEIPDQHLAPIRLTELGCDLTVQAVHRFLHVANHLATPLAASSRRGLVATCTRIEHRAGATTSTYLKS